MIVIHTCSCVNPFKDGWHRIHQGKKYEYNVSPVHCALLSLQTPWHGSWYDAWWVCSTQVMRSLLQGKTHLSAAFRWAYENPTSNFHLFRRILVLCWRCVLFCQASELLFSNQIRRKQSWTSWWRSTFSMQIVTESRRHSYHQTITHVLHWNSAHNKAPRSFPISLPPVASLSFISISSLWKQWKTNIARKSDITADLNSQWKKTIQASACSVSQIWHNTAAPTWFTLTHVSNNDEFEPDTHES